MSALSSVNILRPVLPSVLLPKSGTTAIAEHTETDDPVKCGDKKSIQAQVESKVNDVAQTQMSNASYAKTPVANAREAANRLLQFCNSFKIVTDDYDPDMLVLSRDKSRPRTTLYFADENEKATSVSKLKLIAAFQSLDPSKHITKHEAWFSPKNASVCLSHDLTWRLFGFDLSDSKDDNRFVKMVNDLDFLKGKSDSISAPSLVKVKDTDEAVSRLLTFGRCVGIVRNRVGNAQIRFFFDSQAEKSASIKKIHDELTRLAATRMGFGVKLLELTLKEFDGAWRHNKPGEILSFEIDGNETCYLLGLINADGSRKFTEISKDMLKRFAVK